jgi:hypothetical protein
VLNALLKKKRDRERIAHNNTKVDFKVKGAVRERGGLTQKSIYKVFL